MNIHCKYDELVGPKSLKDHPKNRNKHSGEQIERLAKLYAYHGIRHPIIVSKRSGAIVAGHGRKAAAIKAKIKEMPVVYQEFDSEEAEYAFIQADNAIALWAELDLSGINQDIGGLGPDFDLDLLGIKGFEIEVADKDLGDEEAMPEHVEAKTKLGDIYTLGDHRLMCGDSANVKSLDALMIGTTPDLIATDPPYGMDLETDRRGMGNTKTNYKKIEGDSEEFDPQHILGAFPGVPMILWGADYYCHRIPNWSEGSPIVWAKAHSEDENKVWGSSFETAWVYPKKKRLLWFIRRIHMGSEHIAAHPTQKPTDISTKAFELFDLKDGASVLDMYGGSGSTLIACEKTNRKCFMMELDPHYCDVIVARWEKYTGKKAELIGG